MNNNIHDFVFHFNTYTQKWKAVSRDNYYQLFNGGPDVLTSSEISTLVDLIKRTGGKKEDVEKFVKENQEAYEQNSKIGDIS